MEKESTLNLREAIKKIAKELVLQERQIEAVIKLLDAGNTIPFIARYRKEATLELDEIALRKIEDWLERTRELSARKATVLKSISDQGLLTTELQKQIEICEDLHTLEAIYLPFKPKRRSRATIARERGLQSLADYLIEQKNDGRRRADILAKFVDPAKDVSDPEAALQGALDIVAEQWAEDLETRKWFTEEAFRVGQIGSAIKRGKKDEAEKFDMYKDHVESVARIPSHRFLAMKRGEAAGVLRISVTLDRNDALGSMQSYFLHNTHFDFVRDLHSALEDCFDRLLMPAIESIVLQTLKERADEEAIQVFGKNLRELLMAPPAGPKVTLGVDPGFRTGCKLAVVDGTGKYLDKATIFPTPPTSDTTGAAKVVLGLITKYKIELIAIGNGTASRETDAFFHGLIQENQLSVTKALVSESGASIYSASELAAREYPDLDVTVRGAISIAHRLQDPLAELVKTDPKTIGVGQYQHDVNQNQLRKCLEREVASCVNTVGVDLNTASANLLSYVSGIGPKLAENIITYRNTFGQFKHRGELAKIPKLGSKAFEQAAGFLRIRGGSQPLDNSAVHPESYPIVERMAKKLNVATESLIGNATLTERIRPEEFVEKDFGIPTIRDIVAELAKPGRDPRQEFRVVQFSDQVTKMEDVKPGMILEGIVTNVTHFGAFVDVGVHQDALIHISQLSNTFVKDPNEVISVGNVVRVKILEVDVTRKRIAATKRF